MLVVHEGALPVDECAHFAEGGPVVGHIAVDLSEQDAGVVTMDGPFLVVVVVIEGCLVHGVVVVGHLRLTVESIHVHIHAEIT